FAPPIIATATSTSPEPETPIVPSVTTPPETLPPRPTKRCTPVSVSASDESAPAVCVVRLNEPPACANPATSTDTVPAAATETVPSSALIEAGTMSLTVECDQSIASGLAVKEPPVTDSVSALVPVAIVPARPEPWTATCLTPAMVAIATSTLPEPPTP